MNNIENHPIFVLFAFFLLLSFFFSSMAFIIPRWYAKWPTAQASFENVGLWEICFNGYMHDDIYDRLFSDCFYLDNPLISELKSWIFKGWFHGARVIFTINYLSTMLATFYCIAISMGILSIFKRRNAYVLLGFLFVSWISCLITLILFGVGTQNLKPLDWMPNPDQCTLSWSYGSASLSLLGCMICFGLIAIAFARSKGQKFLYWSTCDSLKQMKEVHELRQLNNSHKDTATFSPPSQRAGGSLYDPRGTPSKLTSNMPNQSVISGSHMSGSRHNIPQTLSQVDSSVLSQPTEEDHKNQKYKKKPHHHSGSDLRPDSSRPLLDSIRHQSSSADVSFNNEMTSPPASQMTVSSRTDNSRSMRPTANMGQIEPAKPMRKK